MPGDVALAYTHFIISSNDQTKSDYLRTNGLGTSAPTFSSSTLTVNTQAFSNSLELKADVRSYDPSDSVTEIEQHALGDAAVAVIAGRRDFSANITLNYSANVHTLVKDYSGERVLFVERPARGGGSNRWQTALVTITEVGERHGTDGSLEVTLRVRNAGPVPVRGA